MTQKFFAATVFFAILLILVLVNSNKYFNKKPPEESEVINLGRWPEATLNEIIYEAQELDNINERVDFISRKFLNTPYKAKTLIGDEKTEEKLVINFEAFDCITFLDKVIAMSLAKDFNDFKNRLKGFRYKNAEVSFSSRNHFFSDWLTNNSKILRDVTQEIGGAKTKSVVKNLNQNEDGSKYLSGLDSIERKINYIESGDVDKAILAKLKTGDLIGYYSPKQGLDVSHTGIVINKDGEKYIRNASSKKGLDKVLDENLLEILKQIPGLVIYRLI